MPKIDPSRAPVRMGASYPEPHGSRMRRRRSVGLGDAGGLTQFGANLVTVQPADMSSLRHWHHDEDEFLMVLEGELTLVEDDGEHPLGPGDAAAFPAGVENGHHLVNRTDGEARFLVVGTRTPAERTGYSDVDMRVERIDGEDRFTRRDGSPLDDQGEQT